MSEGKKRSGLKVFGAVLAATLILCFTPMNVSGWNKTMNAICDAGHFPLFGLLAFTAIFLLSRTPSFDHGKRQALLVTLGVLVSIFIAALIEVIQPIFGRSEQFDDLITGGIGALYGGLGGALFLKRKNIKIFALYLALLLPIAVFLLREVPRAYSADAYRRQHYPRLGDFEDELEMLFWSSEKHILPEDLPARVEANPATGGFALHIRGRQGMWIPAMYAAGKQDWSKFTELRFSAFNPGAPFPLLVRVDDDGDCKEVSGRFNIQVSMKTGNAQYAIPMEKILNGPKSRKLNISKIKSLIIAVPPIQEGKSAEVYLDDLRLQ